MSTTPTIELRVRDKGFEVCRSIALEVVLRYIDPDTMLWNAVKAMLKEVEQLKKETLYVKSKTIDDIRTSRNVPVNATERKRVEGGGASSGGEGTGTTHREAFSNKRVARRVTRRRYVPPGTRNKRGEESV